MVKKISFINQWLLACLLALALPMTSVFAVDNSTNQTVKTDDIVITVNVNTASAEEISTLLKGVGLKKAQAIVEYRDQHGPFASKDDLTKVKGIGASTVKKNEDRILL